MAFAAQIERVPRVALLLLLANMLWTVVYDTMYAMVDRDDDLRIGVRSTAHPVRRFGPAHPGGAHGDDAGCRCILAGQHPGPRHLVRHSAWSRRRMLLSSTSCG